MCPIEKAAFGLQESLLLGLSVPALYWSDALYNCALVEALAEGTWKYRRKKSSDLRNKNLQFSHSAEKSCHSLIPPKRSIFTILSS